MQFCDVVVRTLDRTCATQVNLQQFTQKIRKNPKVVPKEYIKIYSLSVEKQDAIHLIIVCDKQGKILKQYPETDPNIPCSFTEQIAKKKPDVGRGEYTITNEKYIHFSPAYNSIDLI